MGIFIQIGFYTKTNINNLNSGFNEGNVTPLKKVKYNGKDYAYVTGQAARQYLKSTMRQNGLKLTPENKDGYVMGLTKEQLKDKAEANRTIIKEHADLDIFGYMQPKESLRRQSVIKSAYLLSTTPYNQNNRDLLTRRMGTDTNEEGKENLTGALVETELNVMTYMRGCFIIDYNRIGYFEDDLSRGTGKKDGYVIDEQERKNRFNQVIDGIQHLNGGAKSARMMDDLTPQLVIAAISEYGNPFLLNAMELVDGKLNLSKLQEYIEANKEALKSNVMIAAMDKSMLDGEIPKNMELLPMKELFDKLRMK